VVFSDVANNAILSQADFDALVASSTVAGSHVVSAGALVFVKPNTTIDPDTGTAQPIVVSVCYYPPGTYLNMQTQVVDSAGNKSAFGVRVIAVAP